MESEMENQTVEHFDANDWPRDFDVRAEVAEQAELLDADDAHE
jgi:hypothetical protein